MRIRRGGHVVLALIAAVVAAGGPTVALPVLSDAAAVERVGEFRPFPRHNKLGGVGIFNAVDSARRVWFMASAIDPTDGSASDLRVWWFNLDTMRQVGEPLRLPGGGLLPQVYHLDLDSGLLFVGYQAADGEHIAVVRASGPKLSVVGDWAVSPRLVLRTQAGTTTQFAVRGVVTKGDQLYLAADADNGTASGVMLARATVSRLLAGQDPFGWRYEMKQCPGLPKFRLPTAIGPSRYGNYVLVPCRSTPSFVSTPRQELQGMNVVTLGSGPTAGPADFTEAFYPIAGDYSVADSFFDPVTDRVAMRRVNPAQLVIFDGRNRVFMQPVVLGRENIYQAGFDPQTGRLYGEGNEPAAGQSGKEYLFIPELRTSPPQNGVQVDFPSPTPSYTVDGSIAVDSATGRIFVGDHDAAPEPRLGEPDGLFFHVYRDPRPPLPERKLVDPDDAVVNYSGEAQGYGARVSYVGGMGSAFSNAFGGLEYSGGAVVSGGTRHAVFAHSERLRLSESESTASAISANDEATAPETNDTGWPYRRAACRDFATTPQREEAQGSVVECHLEDRTAKSASTYKSPTDDDYSSPVQYAHSEATIRIDARRGVVVTVTATGSLDIPGVVHIGKVTARAESAAAGAAGRAKSTYERTMENVVIGTDFHCTTDCDPHEVAREINETFAGLASRGTMVVAEVPDPDPTLRHSKGGAQAIVQRDFWDREQDLGLHDSGESHYELPAFTITIYRDRKYPQHEVYNLAGVQAASRLPRSLADDIDDIASPDGDSDKPLVAKPVDGMPFGGGDDTAGAPGGGEAVGPLDPAAATDGRRPRMLELSRQLVWVLRSPFRAPAVVAAFAFLLWPVYLAARRRLLLSYRPDIAGE